MMNKSENIEKFIISYLTENYATDALDEKFHEQFYQEFGGKRQETFYGAQMVYKAQHWLNKMYKEKTLNRRRISFGETEKGASGYPNWVYSYTLRQ